MQLKGCLKILDSDLSWFMLLELPVDTQLHGS